MESVTLGKYQLPDVLIMVKVPLLSYFQCWGFELPIIGWCKYFQTPQKKDTSLVAHQDTYRSDGGGGRGGFMIKDVKKDTFLSSASEIKYITVIFWANLNDYDLITHHKALISIPATLTAMGPQSPHQPLPQRKCAHRRQEMKQDIPSLCSAHPQGVPPPPNSLLGF